MTTTEKQVAGALKSAIDAHGPITKDRIGSAAKRVAGAVESHPPDVRRSLAEYRPPRKRLVLVRGDWVKVNPSRPKKQDGWDGEIVDLFEDKGGVTALVTFPKGSPRPVRATRIDGRTTRPSKQDG